jgi:HNH endonuclease
MNKSKRQAVKVRANFLCEYCLCPEYFSPDPFECDHIIPTAKGGIEDLINLALACSGCNGFKSDNIHDPATGQLAFIYNPRKNNWEEHFCWNEDFTLILGLSPIGRATIFKLQLNRQSIINLRHVLCQVGEHPPKR